MHPDAVTAFANQVARAVGSHVGEPMTGAYLFGSAAVGDWQPATSDIDLAVVATEPFDAEQLRRLADLVLGLAEQAPARGLEFVLYSSGQAANPDGSVTLNVNGGPRMDAQVDIGITDFWFAIDASILRDTAVPLVGQPAQDVFGPVPDAVVKPAVERSLRWHAEHAADRPHAAVLAACRSWRFLAKGDWWSKSAAAAWAADRLPERASLIAAAVAARGQAAAEVPAADAAAFVRQIRTRYF